MKNFSIICLIISGVMLLSMLAYFAFQISIVHGYVTIMSELFIIGIVAAMSN